MYLQFAWGMYDKDYIDKSGNKIALSGGSECFGREVRRGGSKVVIKGGGREKHLVLENLLVAADLTRLQQPMRETQ